MWLSDKIRKRETPFWLCLYKFAKRIRKLNFPVIRPLHLLLRAERYLRHTAWDGLLKYIYYEPMFKTYCESCGKSLNLLCGLPQVIGPLKLYIGDNVTLHGVATFVAGKSYDNTVLTVGNNSHLGYQMGISVGTKVIIGDNVLIANRVSLVGYDPHPLDPVLRSQNLPPDESGCGDIIIEDYAWIGMNSLILKNVTVGKASIVAAGSVVTKDVPPYTIVAGNPAVVVKNLDQLKNKYENT